MLNSNSLYNKRVYALEKKKSLGRIRAFVFYEKNCVGFFIKRPDFLWMFHRKPVFVSLGSCQINKKGVFVKTKSELKKNSLAIVNKDANKDDLVLWLEMPVKIGKKEVGYIANVSFDEKSGALDCIELSKGALAGAILGKSIIDGKDVKGYSAKTKAIMLKDGASIKERKDGVAEKAGKTTSYVIHKVKKTTPKVVDSMQEQSDKIHDMFNEFKDELKKGMEEE